MEYERNFIENTYVNRKKGADFCVNVASFYNLDIRFWNCSESVVFFVFHFI
jgi:hypothetical protein